jgi:hypothetical protein
MYEHDDSDWELPEAHEDDDIDALTRECPACGAAVYEDAEQCPACGEWITQSTRAWDGKPVWWIALGLLGILAVILALLPGI